MFETLLWMLWPPHTLADRSMCTGVGWLGVCVCRTNAFRNIYCHVIAISMSLTNESVSGDDSIESTWEWCGDATSKLCVEPRIESAIQLPMSICVWWLWWWCRWFCMLFAGWCAWFCGFDDDSNGSQCWISMFESFLRPQLPFIPLWPILNERQRRSEMNKNTKNN